MIEITIANDGSGDETIGNYRVVMWIPKNPQGYGETYSTWKTVRARVENHRREDGWFILARRALSQLAIEMEEGGDSVPTKEQQGRSMITVTYTSEQQLTESEIRELIQNNTPSGFQVKNVEYVELMDRSNES